MTDTLPTYGTVDEVAAKTSYTRAGKFVDHVAADPGDPDATPPVPATPEIFPTKPSLTIVTLWLAEVSRQMDAALSSCWFDVPVDADQFPAITNMLADVVTTIVGEKVTAANNAGRLYELTKNGESEIAVIQNDLVAWVQALQDGLVGMGLTQTRKIAQKNQALIRYLGIPQLRRILPLLNRTGN